MRQPDPQMTQRRRTTATSEPQTRIHEHVQARPGRAPQPRRSMMVALAMPPPSHIVWRP